MKTVSKIVVGLILTILPITSVFAQDSGISPVSGKQLIYKIANYSVETDKLIQKEFQNDIQHRIVYTCIPAGILVVETQLDPTTNDKEVIQSKLKKINQAINFIQMQGATLKDAEEKCSNLRKVN